MVGFCLCHGVDKSIAEMDHHLAHSQGLLGGHGDYAPVRGAIAIRV